MWHRCRPCDVQWKGTDPCWSCGEPGQQYRPPTMTSTYAVTIPTSWLKAHA